MKSVRRHCGRAYIQPKKYKIMNTKSITSSFMLLTQLSDVKIRKVAYESQLYSSVTS